MEPQVYFYFDSKSFWNTLIDNRDDDLFDYHDKGDEFVCYVNVPNGDYLNRFLKLLFEQGLTFDEISTITSEIWEGNGYDELEVHFGEEESENIIDSSWVYLEGLYK